MEATDRQAAAQSTFVTVLAWIFIALSGLATFIAILQNVVINTVFPFEQMDATLAKDASTPAMALFLFGHLRLIFFAVFAVSATTLAAAIGLLKRRNWARLGFIALLSLGIVWNVVGLVVQHAMLGAAPPTQNVPPELAADFQAMSSRMFVVGAVMAAGFSLLYGWLILRLASPAVRAEFVR